MVMRKLKAYREVDPRFPKEVQVGIKTEPAPAGELVKEFMLWGGHPVRDKPQLIEVQEHAKVMGWVYDELKELLDARKADDLKEIADAFGDIVYFIYGLSWRYGVDLDQVVEEIHRSNMSKGDENGNPIFRADNKIMKGPGYFPSDIEAVLVEQGWNAR